jgi:drug/metabolite transporter (DMT)-like permease
VASHAVLRGYLLVCGAVLFWGGSASLAKHLLAARQYDTVTLVQMRSTFSFLMFSLYFLLRDPSVFRFERQDLWRLMLIGVVGLAATNFTYYYTFRASTIATAILVQYTAPVLVMIYMVAVRKEESLSTQKGLSLLLALLGCFLAVSGGDVSAIQLRGWAIASGIGSSLGYAYMLVGSKELLKKYSVWTMLTYAFGFATLFWLVVNPPWVIARYHYGAEDWVIFWLFAMVSILIPHTMFMASLKLLEASTAGIASTLEPVVAIVVAYLALGEALNGVQIVGAVAVIAAVLLLQVKPYHRSRMLVRTDGE